MISAKRSVVLYVASLGLLLSANTAAQAPTAAACEAEIEKADRAIAEARRASQYKSEKGRQALTSADRSLNQARKHASKGESRSCVTAAQKGRSQLSVR